MFLCKIALDGEQYVAIHDGQIIRTLHSSAPKLSKILESQNPLETAKSYLDGSTLSPSSALFLPPIDGQEVWAAGVTYKRSRTARMEESQGADRFYDMVYEAPRPELFYKSSPHRVVGPQQAIRIRKDALWNVPEPELTLVLNSRLSIVGYTVGNDVSSRDIEGENPLYLPQAKVYDASCALGPWITLAADLPPLQETTITLEIVRDGKIVFSGSTSAGQIHRSLECLVDYLGRDNSFPNGVFLMTGTGIVPDAPFTLGAGDLVNITISGIGTLTNSVVQGV